MSIVSKLLFVDYILTLRITINFVKTNSLKEKFIIKSNIHLYLDFLNLNLFERFVLISSFFS